MPQLVPVTKDQVPGNVPIDETFGRITTDTVEVLTVPVSGARQDQDLNQRSWVASVTIKTITGDVAAFQGVLEFLAVP